MGVRKKILLVDDDLDTIKFLTFNFIREGYNVVSTSNGYEGIAIAEEIKPDIIISEIFLPGTNGIEMCRIIRSKEGFQTLPIIILSVSGDELHYLSAMFAGAHHYEMKPAKFSYLHERVLIALAEEVTVGALCSA